MEYVLEESTVTGLEIPQKNIDLKFPSSFSSPNILQGQVIPDKKSTLELHTPQKIPQNITS